MTAPCRLRWWKQKSQEMRPGGFPAKAKYQDGRQPRFLFKRVPGIRPRGFPVKYGRANQTTTRAQSTLAIMSKTKRGISGAGPALACRSVKDWLLPRRSRAGPTLACRSVKDWLLPCCNMYHGMHVPRALTWWDVQRHVDLLASSGTLSLDGSGHEDVQVTRNGDGHEHPMLESNLAEGARQLVAALLNEGMPTYLTQQIQTDAQVVGAILAKMFPTIERLSLKLEIFGEASSDRWHIDNNVARALITYNGRGTEMLRHDNVNFWELKNGGTNARIVRDSSEVFSVGAGDILFMKGSQFPGDVFGLVHKSPERRYHADGRIMNRLVLKVDVPSQVARQALPCRW